jgi:hypothetical protein
MVRGMRTSRPRRTLRLSVLACMLALALAASASASQGADTIRLTNEGQAAAKAVVLTKADFGFATGWTGGVVKPDPSSNNSTAGCTTSGSKPVATVTNGDQKSAFTHTGAQVMSEIVILKTSAMVRGDWKRHVGPQLLACLRAKLAKSLKPNERLLSVKARPFAHVATYTQAYRSLWMVPVEGTMIPYAIDFIVFARGRSEATMTTVAPLSPLLNAFETHLARAMATRMVA